MTAPAERSFASDALAGLDPCVHCGFCLPACPTYEVTSDEADSPRGRIVLMRSLARGELRPDDEGLRRHLDRCLGCRGCESVCPSGVVYGPALEVSRAALRLATPLPLLMRAMLWFLAVPSRQAVVWAALRALRGTGLPALVSGGGGGDASLPVRLLAQLAASRPARRPSPAPPANGGREAVLFTGCVMDGLFRHVHEATRTALAANGVDARRVPGLVCCGALAAHAGDETQAQGLARRNVRALAATGGDIVVNSAGCGAMLRGYGEYLSGDPVLAEEALAVAARVRDVSEVLAELGPRPGRRIELRVAYDAPCHLLHAQRVADAPVEMLAAVPGIEMVPLEGSDRCCGSAGLFSLTEPEMAGEVLSLKLEAVRRAGCDVLATGNPGCLLHVGAGAMLDGMEVEVRHPVELLAWSYAE